jgi:hypothetical protein
MGSITINDMRTELAFLLSNRNDADATDSDRIDYWLDSSYRYMCHPSVHKFREMQAIGTSVSMTSGTNEYDITSIQDQSGNYRYVIAIRWVSHIEATSYTPTATKRRLLPRGIRYFEDRTLYTGRPVHYAVDGESLFLSNVPGSAEDGQLLRIGFYAEPINVTVTAVTDLPSYFDRPFMKFAQAFAESDLGDRAKALITLKEAQGLLNNAQEETEMEAEDDGFAVEVVLQPAMGF